MSNRIPWYKKRLDALSSRRVDVLEPIPTFLIVCEGEKTEPNYFRAFRVPREVIDVRGVGDHTISLIEKAIGLSELRDYDQVWCVLDRDSFPAARFNEALELARAKGLRVAYSNEAFELWYVLHFEFLQSGIGRADYLVKLNGLLGRKYEKNSERVYADLLPRQAAAIRNAKKLLALYAPVRPERDNPSTTVHELVQELNRYVRR